MSHPAPATERADRAGSSTAGLNQSDSGAGDRRRIAGPISVAEVTALIRYAAETGLDTEGKTLSASQHALDAYEQAPPADRPHLYEALVSRYAALAALTRPVNGRTLLDTDKANRQLFPLFFLTLALLIIAVGNEILTSWLSEIDTPEGGPLLTLWTVQRHVLTHLSPFIWGGLGACVYLLKKLYDFAQDRCFDSARLHGWFLRVILAAILGAVVLYLFDPSTFSEEGVTLDAKAIAFLVGLGVKVVYGALEKTVETVAEKLNLAAIRRSRVQTADARTFLTQKLTGKATADDPERRRVVNELLTELDQQQTSQAELVR